MSFDLKSWLSKQAGKEEPPMPYNEIAKENGRLSITPADRREWLVTNGLGSYASGCISGANTRKYHGLLIAALQPPTSRTVLLSRVDEYVNGVNISTNLWGPDTVSPRGFDHLVAFSNSPAPTWAYELEKGYLIKQVVMLPGRQEVYLCYSWVGKSESDTAAIDLHFLANHRDFHGETHGSNSWLFQQNLEQNHLKIQAYDNAAPLYISFEQGSYRQEPSWYYNYFFPRETERGLGDREDAFHTGVLALSLQSGESVVIVASTEPPTTVPAAAEVLGQLIAHQESLLGKTQLQSSYCKQLVLAADQFVVKRASTNAHSIIAGYHWFNDWGRDSMISLPGLTLATGRPEIARGILTTFGSYLSEGMLPNNFPDRGEKPHYNTADAALWWGWAVSKYYKHTGDKAFIGKILPDLKAVATWYLNGTRYGIKVDEKDGLLTSGAEGVQLTWMDAKVGDYVVTPRRGKVVELCALWYNFLKTLEELHQVLELDGSEYALQAEKTKVGFQAFWNDRIGCLYDVLETPSGTDASMRPNQLLAVSLRPDLITQEQGEALLMAVECELLTDRGLRSLAPIDPAYCPYYGGDRASANQFDRDITYHQGTAWAWLLGPWADARLHLYGKNRKNFCTLKEILRPFLTRHLWQEGGVGTISEIFDGRAPHSAQGCIAQAWSVAELLRIFSENPELHET